MAKPNKRKLSKKEQKALDKAPILDVNFKKQEDNYKAEKRTVQLPRVVSIKEFADRAKLPVTKIIGELMKNGILANINETVDIETAMIIGDDLGIEISLEEENEKNLEKNNLEEAGSSKNLVERPPVVTIMGHVDHGKTTLLDSIRKEHVAESESGGITQHISAYQVTLKNTKEKNLKHKTITFIDTPGHAAFSSMREHGTAITDIVVLIVAANDGVKPQTVEVISEAQANNVPIIVAINKIDLPDADIMKVKQQLSEYNLISEEWGGKTIMVEISAKNGTGINDLLEIILLQAEMLELKADPNGNAIGVVIESKMNKGTGATAMVLIENGTLKKGNPIAIGGSYGKARILESFNHQMLQEAGPSVPVRVSGLNTVPNFGDKLLAFDSEKEARENALTHDRSTSTLNIATAKKVNTDSHEASDNKKTQEVFVELNIVLKCDVNGSIEAVKKLLFEITNKEIGIKIISEGVGAISESDITLARATNAIVLGFRANLLGAAKKIAENEKIEIKTFDIIYELVDFVKERLSELLPPLILEEELGRGKVLAIFRDDRKGFVAGGTVESGKISLNDEIKFIQNENEKYRDKIVSLRKEKSEAREVQSGSECGFELQPFANVAVGDTFIAFKTIQEKRTIK